jgi:hypothetical protein
MIGRRRHFQLRIYCFVLQVVFCQGGVDDPLCFGDTLGFLYTNFRVLYGNLTLGFFFIQQLFRG